MKSVSAFQSKEGKSAAKTLYTCVTAAAHEPVMQTQIRHYLENPHTHTEFDIVFRGINFTFTFSYLQFILVSVWNKQHTGNNTFELLMMGQNIIADGLSDSAVNVIIPMREKSNGEKTKKCNQCKYASSEAGNLRTHMKTHSGEKSNKCNQCNFASSYANALRTHLKTHSGEKSNKCNQCDYASYEASHLRRHLKTHSGENLNKYK